LEVLIPFANQKMGGSLDVESLQGDRFGLLGRKRRGLGLKDRTGLGLGSGLVF